MTEPANRSSTTKTCPQCGAEYGPELRFCPRDGTTLRSSSGGSDLVGSVVADRYLVIRKLGEGGMGQVYLAEHVKMGRKSAIKVMSPAMAKDADAVSRFNREASNASRITHPNVAAIYDFGETSEGLIYLAMEYVEGEPLTKLVERDGALAPARAADLIRQTADALAVAHDHGIVHRDLKPDNIMIARSRDGSDCVKVVDFGIAKAAAGEAQKVTRTGFIIGTPEYMSPEQLSGDPVDARSDLYSLALVAFQLLTGELPFRAETSQETMILRLTERPSRLVDVRPDVSWPYQLQLVFDRALERDVARRYPTAAEFARDFVRAVETMPTASVRPSDLATSVMAAPATGDRTSPMHAPVVPATRVDAAAGGATAPMTSPAADRTVKLPPTLVTPGVDLPATRAAPEEGGRRSMRPVALAGGLVIAVLGGTLLVNQMGDAKGAEDSASGAPAGATASGVPGTTGSTTAPAAAGATASTFDPRDSLMVLDRMVGDTSLTKEQAGVAEDALRNLLPSLTTKDDSVHAKFNMAVAAGQAGRLGTACDILKTLKTEARGTPTWNNVQAFHDATQCP